MTRASQGIAERLAAEVPRSSLTTPASLRTRRRRSTASLPPGQVFAAHADISRPADIQPLVDATLERFGRLDILVNHAGLYKMDSLDSITPESIDEHYNLSVRSNLLMTQAAARVLPKGGIVVNIGSGLAKSLYPVIRVYSSTMGAVDALTRSMAMEPGPRETRVVGIAPGFTATEGKADLREQAMAVLVGKTPLGCIGLPRDIAATVAYVVSADAAWMPGGMVF